MLSGAAAKKTILWRRLRGFVVCRHAACPVSLVRAHLLVSYFNPLSFLNDVHCICNTMHVLM